VFIGILKLLYPFCQRLIYIFKARESHLAFFTYLSPPPEPRLLETTRLAAGQVHRGGIRGYGKDVSVAKSYKKQIRFIEMH